MTNEQLTQKVIELETFKGKSEAEHEKIELILRELQEDVKSTKTLTEDVHILAINIQSMQKTLDETNRKVDALNSKEFVEYKESKKIIKQNIISKITGLITGAVITGIVWLITMYLNTH